MTWLLILQELQPNIFDHIKTVDLTCVKCQKNEKIGIKKF